MLGYLPEFQYIGAPVTSLATGLTLHTIPAGANGVLLQVFTTAIRIEFDGGAPNADSLQLLSGLDPIVMKLSTGRSFKLGQVTSGASVIIRFIKIG